MKTRQITLSLTLFESKSELESSDQSLLQAARLATLNAYAPYSKFQVGAAVRLKNGQIITGNNQENAAYPSGLCAERVAVFAAAARYPNEPIESIALTARSEKNPLAHPISPCGGCRQVLTEYENRFHQNIRIIMAGESGPVHLIQSAADLLPLQFKSESINH